MGNSYMLSNREHILVKELNFGAEELCLNLLLATFDL